LFKGFLTGAREVALDGEEGGGMKENCPQVCKKALISKQTFQKNRFMCLMGLDKGEY